MKGNNFYDFLFASLNKEAFSEWGHLSKKRNLLSRDKTPLRIEKMIRILSPTV